VTPTPPLGDMPPEEFRYWAHQTVDQMADYLARVGTLPVLPQLQPGEFRAGLPAHPPETGESPADFLRDFDEKIVPALTHWNHPAFLAYFSITGSGPGILGEMLTAAVNVNAMLWRTSPAATELEGLVLDWLLEGLGLPQDWFGVLQDTASSSTLVALAAARQRRWPQVRDEGMSGLPQGRIYTSDQAHSSVEKAAIALGIGQRGVHKVPSDREFRMDVSALREALEQDRLRGVVPIAIVATTGTTSTTSIDPVAEIAEVAREFGAWLHVDAAYGGAAAIVPELRPLFRGWEEADSVVVNPHKWLFTPIDCSVLYARDREELRRAFDLTPEYLRTPEMDQAPQLMDYGLALGRRFRALKLWFVLRYFGTEGIRARIREHLRLASGFAARVDQAADWELCAPVPFSTVVFRYAPAGGEPDREAGLDVLNLAILDEVNASGEVFLSHTRLNGRLVLRVAIGHLNTGETHLARLWTLLQEAAGRGQSGAPPARRP